MMLLRVLFAVKVVLVVVTVGACDPCTDGDSCTRGVFSAPVTTGTLPNDVALGSCGGDRVALVPASGDGRLDALSFDGADARSTYFAPRDDVAASPWNVAAVGDARAVVTLFGQRSVAFVDACAGDILATWTPDTVLAVSPAITLRDAVDADGDGDVETTVSTLLPRTPQAVVVVGDDVYVTFTNILAFGTGPDAPPALGPGWLAHLRIQGDDLTFGEALVLPCQNPTGLTTADDDGVWVSCTGMLGIDDDGAPSLLSPGALIHVDGSLHIAHTIAADDAAPGTAAAADGVVVVGSLVERRVFAAARDASAVGAGTRVGDGGVASVFTVRHSSNGLWLAPVFDDDILLAWRTPTAVADAARFALPTAGGGAQALAIDGDDAAVLLGLSAQVVLFHPSELEVPR